MQLIRQVRHALRLGVRYGRRAALNDCTLDIPAGHVVGLVGPNGAGKSTLLQLACGLLTPTTGRIEVLGARPVSGSPRTVRSPRGGSPRSAWTRPRRRANSPAASAPSWP